MDVLPIINQTYDIYKTTVEINSRLEKRWRFNFGKELEASVLEYLEILIMAKNAPKPMKVGFLLNGVAKLEIITLKFRLMLELKLVNETQIFQTQAKLAEIGRMLGGWLKAVQSL